MKNIIGTFRTFLASVISKLIETPRRSVFTLIVPLVVAVIGLQALTFTPVARFIDQKIFHPIAFMAREKIRPQKLDPRIKIFSFDNRTAAYLKALDIPLDIWGLVISAIAETPDTKILISKLFDSSYSSSEIETFSNRLKSTASKTVIQAFTYPGEIAYRSPIPDALFKDNQQKTIIIGSAHPAAASWVSKSTPYGASPELLKSFFAFGHNEYKGDHRQSPAISISEKGLLTHASLAMLDDVSLTGRTLSVNQHNVKVSSDGKILVNFFPKETYQKASYSLLAVVERAKKSQDISVVKPGDYVVILPAMYTGSTDHHETPFGSLPGGYVLVTMLNSALTGNWLTEIDDYGLMILLFAITGFIMGALLKPGLALSAISITAIVLMAGSIGLFVFAGVAYSFVLPLFSLVISGLTGLVLHGNLASIEEVRIHKELEVATLVQKSFFPKVSDTQQGVTAVEGRFIPASECGGDWWGCYRRHGYTYIMLGDAVGHGVPAALVTAVAFSVSRSIDMELEAAQAAPVAPSRFLKSINDILCEMNSKLACMTFLIFRIHEESGETVFSNAGNLQPVLIPKSDQDQRLAKSQRLKTLLARGDVLGLGRDLDVEEHRMTLKSGDKIALYTDGLIENKSPKTKEPLGKKWLKDIMTGAASKGSNQFCDQIWASYSHEVGASKVADDVTLVVIERP